MKRMIHRSVLLAVWFAAVRLASGEEPQAFVPVEGDVLFQSLPHNPLIDAIEGCSHSVYSHCGLVVDRNGRAEVLEASSTVHFTGLSDWIARGRGKTYAAYRLRKSAGVDAHQLVRSALHYRGRGYDIHYSFANNEIYCSELVFLAYKDLTGKPLGKVRKLGELDWGAHIDLIRRIEGGKVPLEREMITPVDLARSPELEQVFSNFRPDAATGVGK